MCSSRLPGRASAVDRYGFAGALASKFDAIQQDERNAAEQEHGYAIFNPVHLPLFIDATNPVNEPFDRPQQEIQEGALPFEHTVEKYTHGFRQQQNRQEIQQNLQPTDPGHGQNFSGFSSA
jgi:hypothetical protein